MANMDSPVGVYSTKENPLPQPSRVSSQCGPGGNADQQKADRLLKAAYQEKEKLRGKSGM
jgi:hypothetical protein